MPENVVFVGEGARIRDIARFMSYVMVERRLGSGSQHQVSPLYEGFVYMTRSTSQRPCRVCPLYRIVISVGSHSFEIDIARAQFGVHAQYVPDVHELGLETLSYCMMCIKERY